MKLKIRILVLLSIVMMSFAPVFAANGCTTERLSTILGHFPAIDLSSLSAKSIFLFDNQGNKITIRTNEWNEVEHAGLKILPDEFRKNNYLPVCDFVERYLLELLLLSPEQRGTRMKNDDVVLEGGKLEEFFALSDNNAVSFHSLDFRAYRAEWLCNGKTLGMVFPMDYQLIAGCDIIELEKNYLRDLSRYKGNEKEYPRPSVPNGYDKEYFLQDGGSYLSPSVRHDLYFQKKDGVWRLLCDVRKPEWSLGNLALSPVAVGEKPGNFILEMKLDRYGYQSTSVRLPMERWVAFNEEAGGTPYFIVKETDSSAVKGLVLFPDERGGYCHVLSIEMQLSALEHGGGVITGRMFAFIPLHNVADEFFN